MKPVAHIKRSTDKPRHGIQPPLPKLGLTDRPTPLSLRRGAGGEVNATKKGLGVALNEVEGDELDPTKKGPPRRRGQVLWPVEQRSITSYYTPYTFSAKERDPETGYSYFGARYYSSDISVWLSVDPLADKAPWWTPYHYVKANPLSRFDPFGLTDYPIAGKGTKTINDGHNNVSIHVTQKEFNKLEKKFNNGKIDTYKTLRDSYSLKNGFDTYSAEYSEYDNGGISLSGAAIKAHKPGQHSFSQWYNSDQKAQGKWNAIHVRAKIPIIDGPGENSIQNLGMMIRETCSNLNGLTNGGKTPVLLQMVSNINPLVSGGNAYSYFTHGHDIHGNESTWPIASGIISTVSAGSALKDVTMKNILMELIFHSLFTKNSKD
jgi:RHS repeat-associated protein